MNYIATFKLSNRIIDTVTFVERTFPQVLVGQPMTRQMMIELVNAEFPDATVTIVDLFNTI